MSLASEEDANPPVAGPNGLTPPHGIPVAPGPDQVLEETFRRLVGEFMSQHGGGDGGGPPPVPPKTVLGDTPKGWASWVIKGMVVVVASLFAWYTYVNDAIEVRPTYEEAAEMTVEAIETHEAYGEHPRLKAIIEAQATQLEKLGEIQDRQTHIQTRQTVLLEAQGQKLEALDKTIERHRNRQH